MLSYNYPIFNVFKYVTLRSICAFLCSFMLGLLLGKRVIYFLYKYQKHGQPIRADGPEIHLKTKKGTPTMGGIIILINLIVSTILWADLNNKFVIAAITAAISFGFIGAMDDFLKLCKNNSKGISGKKKFLLQIVAGACCYYICTGSSTMVYMPIFKNFAIDLGCFFVIWAVLVMVGTSNAVNLTDGLDGLAMGPVIMSSICLAIIGYLVGNSVFANYLHMEYIPGMSEICVFLGGLIGASLGFLWFNAPPAKVFMGDTGSIAIGGVLGFVAVITKHELIFAIIGGIFVIETISVIIQISYFKITRKRIFLMAPIHHHFEKKGWAESIVVFRFWIISIVLGILGLAILKLR